MNKFETFELKPFLLKAVEKKGFTRPTEIQKRLIAKIREGLSVIGQSQTGSGKTHAYLLPLFDRLDPQKKEVQVVITAPSRELAEQIYQDAQYLASFAPETIQVSNYTGGTDKKRQLGKLGHQQPQVVIGTPGRLVDLSQDGALKLYTAKALVVDEADMALDMGFLPDVDKIASQLPQGAQFLIFSATIPQKIQPFLKKYFDHPTVEMIDTKSAVADTVVNKLLSIKGQSRNQVIYRLLTMGEPYLAIVFSNTKKQADALADFLKEQGLKVAKIHGDLPPRERKRLMREVKNMQYQFIVATDLAARGIDIEGVSLVINEELPNDPEFFVHRVGRTGRNGLKGEAITLYGPDDEETLTWLEKKGVHFIPVALKDGELVETHDRKRRVNRKKKKDELDPELIGLMKKKKKKIKPGYKKKINRAIADKNKQNRRQERVRSERQRRKAKKDSNS